MVRKNFYLLTVIVWQVFFSDSAITYPDTGWRKGETRHISSRFSTVQRRRIYLKLLRDLGRGPSFGFPSTGSTPKPRPLPVGDRKGWNSDIFLIHFRFRYEVVVSVRSRRWSWGSKLRFVRLTVPELPRVEKFVQVLVVVNSKSSCQRILLRIHTELPSAKETSKK